MFHLYKKTKPLPDYSMLERDFHSHLLPGIDDGAKTMDDSLELIEGLRRLGFRTIITTPHINWDRYPNSAGLIKEKQQEVQSAMDSAGIELNLHAAAEYYLDEHVAELIEKKELLPVWDNCVLVELGFYGASPYAEQWLFRMQTKGFRPILAHPERYLYYADQFDQYGRLKNLGCQFQGNLMAFMGHYGNEVKKNALRLLRKGFYDYLATDCHNTTHLEELEAGLKHKEVIEAVTKVSKT